MIEAKEIKSDVIVIGGGLAGMRAAMEAHDQGADVILAMKGKLGKMNAAVCSYHCAAVGPWGEADDSFELHLKDVIHAGGFLADQELCKIMIEELPERCLEMERYGLMWERNENGDVEPYLGAGHSRTRTISTWMRQGGVDMAHSLRSEMRRRKIPLIEDFMATKLLTVNGTVAGVVGLDYLNGQVVVIRAKSVVMATGSHNRCFPVSTPPPEGTGDGVAISYRVGAELMNMEFVVFVTTPAFPRTFRGVLVPTLFRIGDETLHLLNAKHERIMERYSPEDLEMATKDIIARSIQTEIREGRGGGEEGDLLYADLRHLPYQAAKEKCGDLVFCMGKAGIDITKEMIPIRPAAHETLGGIRINKECASSVPGLYAAGSTIGAIYGNDGIPGRGIGHALVFGKRAGEYAAKNALENKNDPFEDLSSEIEKEKERIYSILNRDSEVRVFKVLKDFQAIMGQYFPPVKNEKSLQEGLARLLSLKEENVLRVAPSYKTKRFNMEWRNILELENLFEVSEIMFKTAMMRKETRTMFLRDDYTKTDDENWLKHIIVKKMGDKIHLATTPIELKYVAPEKEGE